MGHLVDEALREGGGVVSSGSDRTRASGVVRQSDIVAVREHTHRVDQQLKLSERGRPEAHQLARAPDVGMVGCGGNTIRGEGKGLWRLVSDRHLAVEAARAGPDLLAYVSAAP